MSFLVFMLQPLHVDGVWYSNVTERHFALFWTCSHETIVDTHINIVSLIFQNTQY